MSDGVGKMTFHHTDGDEVFILRSAVLRGTHHPNEYELFFYVKGDRAVGEGRELTNAEVSVFLPKFDPDELVGRRFEVPLSYDPSRGDHVSCVYYFEHNDLNRITVDVLEWVGDRLRVKWSGVMSNSAEDLDSGSRVDIEGVFDVLGITGKS